MTEPELTHRGTSPYRGVSWCWTSGQWMAKRKVGGRVRYLGRYATEAEAAAAVTAFVRSGGTAGALPPERG